MTEHKSLSEAIQEELNREEARRELPTRVALAMQAALEAKQFAADRDNRKEEDRNVQDAGNIKKMEQGGD